MKLVNGMIEMEQCAWLVKEYERHFGNQSFPAP